MHATFACCAAAALSVAGTTLIFRTVAPGQAGKPVGHLKDAARGGPVHPRPFSDPSPLGTPDRSLAAEMIENSDNDAATVLWDSAGGAAGLATADKILGLHHTVPGPDDYWGLTSTTVTDQVRLLSGLTSPHSPLAGAYRRYELALMRGVAAGQNWGVTAAADPGTHPAVKNGWMPDGPQGLWVINSIGVISHGGDSLLVACFQAASHRGTRGSARPKLPPRRLRPPSHARRAAPDAACGQLGGINKIKHRPASIR